MRSGGRPDPSLHIGPSTHCWLALHDPGTITTILQEARGGSRGPQALSGGLANLAGLLSVRGESDEADSLYREALAIDPRLGVIDYASE